MRVLIIYFLMAFLFLATGFGLLWYAEIPFWQYTFFHCGSNFCNGIIFLKGIAVTTTKENIFGFFYQEGWLYYTVVLPLILIFKGRHREKLDKNKSDSHFASISDIKNKMGLLDKPEQGIVIGTIIDPLSHEQQKSYLSRFFAKRKSARLLRKTTSFFDREKFKNIYITVKEPLSIVVFAPPGTGKTAGIIIPTLLINKTNSLIVFDVKGEIFASTSKERSKCGKVLQFNPTDPDHSVKWNPLDLSLLPSEPAELYPYIQNMAKILLPESSGGDKFWSLSAQNLLSALLFANVLLAKKDGRSTSIPEVMRNLGRVDEIVQEEEEEKAANKDKSPVQKLLAYYKKTLSEYNARLSTKIINLDNLFQALDMSVGSPEQTFSGVYQQMVADLGAFVDTRVMQVMESNEVDVLSFKKNADTLYIVVRPNDIERLAGLVRLFFETTATIYLSTPVKKTDKVVTLLLDEFPRLGKMDVLLKMPALSRGQKMNAVYIAQDGGQIEKIYEKTGLEEIMSTTSYKVILAQNSYQRAEEISKMLGNKTIASRNKNTDKSARDYSYSGKEIPLISPSEVMSLELLRDVVITVQNFGQHPIKRFTAAFFKNPALLSRVGEISQETLIQNHESCRPKNTQSNTEQVEELLPLSVDEIDKLKNKADLNLANQIISESESSEVNEIDINEIDIQSLLDNDDELDELILSDSSNQEIQKIQREESIATPPTLSNSNRQRRRRVSIA